MAFEKVFTCKNLFTGHNKDKWFNKRDRRVVRSNTEIKRRNTQVGRALSQGRRALGRNKEECFRYVVVLLLSFLIEIFSFIVLISSIWQTHTIYTYRWNWEAPWWASRSTVGIGAMGKTINWA